ncbi:MAG: pitrilysin family protein [Nitrospinae bacterium]|jgi:predicted Zn-dependent peptidase|nr:pitrilysin family protein [Nitrospinota bacterium]MDA1108699.1 pitrilysin family protein [Nitrospinota bacterium]
MKLKHAELRNITEALPNGMTVVTIEMPHFHTMEMALFVRAGLRFENKQNNGVSHFLEHMLYRGNAKYPDSLSLNREFETVGRELRASTLCEYTCFAFSPHISQIKRAVELFADFFSEPTFPQIELEREIILEECLEELNEKGENVDIDNIACRLLYQGSSLSMPTIGTESTIKSINKEMLQEYFNAYYHASNMIFVGAGPIVHEEFFDLVKQYFSKIPDKGEGIAIDHFNKSLNEDQKSPAQAFQYDSDSQIQLQLCFRSVSYNHPDYFPLCLIGRVFDDGFSSRLQRALREDRGLVYSVDCRITSFSDTGTVDFDVNVRPEKVCQVATILIDEIKKLLETGPSQDELNFVKQRYFFELDVDQDDPCKQISRYGLAQLYSKVISADEEWALVEPITREEIINVARKIFVPENLNMVIVGPYTEEIKKELEGIVESFQGLPAFVS